MMRIRTVHALPQPVDDVVAWHDRPGALARLTPPGIATPDDPGEGGMRAGRLVGMRLGPPQLPIRPHSVMRHLAHDAPGRFVDRQSHGPFRTWEHTHEIVGTGEGTSALVDTIELELPSALERFEPVAAEQARRLLAFRARQVRDDLAFHARYAEAPRLTVAIAGSTGMIGTQVAALLETGGHTVRRMIREDPVGPGEISWDPSGGVLDPADLEGVDVVVNLAGRSIATRWTDGARSEIRSSRLRGTALIARTLAQMADGPSAFVQGTAVGVYGGQRPGELLTEDDPGGEGFLADLVRDWEAATAPAARAGARVVRPRTGVVLSDGGGSLTPQLPLFRLGLGGRVTRADAVQSWITLDDLARAFAHAALTPGLDGPVNAVAPQPVTAGELARTLGRVLRRPALVPVPPFGPRLLLGDDAVSELIDADQRVSDAKLRSSGFDPAHHDLETALRHVLRR